MGSFILTALFALNFSQAATGHFVPKVFLEFWNGTTHTRYNNNCYNYATNRVTNNFAQPGEASDKMYESLSCESVHQAASNDLGLIPTDYFNFTTKNDETLIALVVAPDYDYHWYRRDDNNRWTHKPGGTPATRLDESGKLITDPETADRGYYTDFCGYFRIKTVTKNVHEQDGGQVRIGNMKELPNNISSEVQILKFSGRENPKYSLKQLIQNKELKSLFAKVQSEIENLNEISHSLQGDIEEFHLGYNGILVIDHEGLISEKGTEIRFKDGKVYVRSPGVAETFMFNSSDFSILEGKLLSLK